MADFEANVGRRRAQEVGEGCRALQFEGDPESLLSCWTALLFSGTQIFGGFKSLASISELRVWNFKLGRTLGRNWTESCQSKKNTGSIIREICFSCIDGNLLVIGPSFTVLRYCAIFFGSRVWLMFQN